MQPHLFPVDVAKPTTRDISRLAKEGGAAALPGAEERSDHARYQEITCRSALNRTVGTPFRWTLNPYRGCTHGCHYCFARRYQSQLELNAGDDFSSVILVKANFVEVLRRELDRPAWTREYVAFGTATDPYQPIEGHYRLTRGALDALAQHRTPVGLVTKGPMVVRDIDLLQELSRSTLSTVYMSVPTVDEEAWSALEPGTAHPRQRLRAVKTLIDAGVRTAVLMAPLVPGFSTAPAKIERTLAAIRDTGAHSVSGMVLHLEGGTRDHFMRFLREGYPDLAPRIDALFPGKRARKDYLSRVHEVVSALKARYGFADACDRGTDDRDNVLRPEPREGGSQTPSQCDFTWPGSGSCEQPRS